MTVAANQLYCGIDFEGSGASKTLKDAPVQIGTAFLEPNKTIIPALDSHINPGRRITSHAYRIHKIGYKEVINAPKIYSFYKDIKEASEKAIFVAHSTSTEKRYLKAAFPLLRISWIDTLTIARYAYPNIKSHKLENCFALTNKEEELRKLLPNKNWHDAIFDATASLLFLQHCLNLPGWEEITTLQLMVPPKHTRNIKY